MVVYTGKSRKNDWDDFSVCECSFEEIERVVGRAANYTSGVDDSTNLMNHLAARVVIDLTKPLVHKGYILFVDNFYSSAPLFQYLLSVGINAVGTVRENSSSFPTDMKGRLSRGKKIERGSIRYKRIVENPKEVLLLQWVDRNVVSVLSTYHSPNDNDFCIRNTKIEGIHKKLKKYRPICICDYNKNMNGVDLSDQMNWMYSVQYRTRKFWKTLFFHFIDICAWNAYLFWRELRNPTPDQRMPRNYSFLDFKKDLVLQLAFIEQKAISLVPKVNESLSMKVENLDEFICKASANAVACCARRRSKHTNVRVFAFFVRY